MQLALTAFDPLDEPPSPRQPLSCTRLNSLKACISRRPRGPRSNLEADRNFRWQHQKLGHSSYPFEACATKMQQKMDATKHSGEIAKKVAEARAKP